MDVTDFKDLWEKLADGGNSIVFVGLILSNILTAFLSRAKSKDKKESEIMKETMSRQKEIDKQQHKLVDQMRSEISRHGEEMKLIRDEARQQKSDNMELYSVNRDLTTEIFELKLELDRKDSDLRECERKNDETSS